jgi:hypothetical protein
MTLFPCIGFVDVGKDTDHQVKASAKSGSSYSSMELPVIDPASIWGPMAGLFQNNSIAVRHPESKGPEIRHSCAFMCSRPTTFRKFTSEQ